MNYYQLINGYKKLVDDYKKDVDHWFNKCMNSERKQLKSYLLGIITGSTLSLIIILLMN